MKRGRPPKADPTQDAEKALEQWLQGLSPHDLSEDERTLVREALGETEYAVEELN